MLKRYSTPELIKIWSEKSKYESWLKVELYSAEAYKNHNAKIAEKDIQNLWKNSKLNLSRINEIEKETHHDVIAFINQVSEGLGPEKRWFHYGLTSTDVVDTAQSYRLKSANIIIKKRLERLILSIKNLAKVHQYTYQIGRTHGIHAEVTTFGYKLALWFDEMQRNKIRFENASNQIEIAKISGAVGNYSNIPIDIQDYVAAKLGLSSSKISSQTLQRDRHAEYIFSIASIANSIDKFATEIRHLQRTEVNEVQEGFASKQKGSSAMPHKKNPISSENLSGCARLLRGFVVTAMENVALWHERDISHSSSERFILVDATTTIDYMIKRFNDVVNNMVINKEKMKKNIFLTKGIIFSQRAMLNLINKKSWSRQKAYNIIQSLTLESLNKDIDFLKILEEKSLFTKEEIKTICDLSYYSKNIEKVFKKLNII